MKKIEQKKKIGLLVLWETLNLIAKIKCGNIFIQYSHIYVKTNDIMKQINS